MPQALRKFLEPTGLYRRKATYDFLWKFSDLNYKLKYVSGDKVLNFSASQATPQKN